MSLSQPALFVSHGGGPSFFMTDPGGMMGEIDSRSECASFFRRLESQLPCTPSAVLVISAHFEASPLTITSGEKPPLIYDYYGFPKETYSIEYNCPGSPSLASQVKQLLDDAGIESVLDDTRGFDHGVFIPLKLVFPDANIPVVQLSLHPSLDPSYHINVGMALSSLREQGVLIFASGSTTHNLRELRPRIAPLPWAVEFDRLLCDALTSNSPESSTSFEERKEGLLRLIEMPVTRTAHPRTEHLIPLYVAFGSCKSGNVQQIFSSIALGSLSLSMYRFD